MAPTDGAKTAHLPGLGPDQESRRGFFRRSVAMRRDAALIEQLAQVDLQPLKVLSEVLTEGTEVAADVAAERDLA